MESRFEREFFSLAADESAFWSMAAASRKVRTRRKGAYFGEFLRRVMMNAAPLSRPGDIAWFLASYARDALATLEKKDGSNLAPLRTSLEDGTWDQVRRTRRASISFALRWSRPLFYGVFSAWVNWAKDGSSSGFDWKSAGYSITVPMVGSLFEEIAKPSRLAPLGLMGVLDRAGEALESCRPYRLFSKTFDSGEGRPALLRALP